MEKIDLNTSIEDLNFTIRTANCLKNMGVNTVRNLIKTSAYEILKARNSSKQVLLEIEEKLSFLLSLKMADTQLEECSDPVCLVTTMTKTISEARKIAKTLLKQNLAVSCQMTPEIESFYFWDNKIQNKKEIRLTCFSTVSKYENIQEVIKEIHSYQLPQIVCTPITNMLPEFGKWIKDYVSSVPKKEIQKGQAGGILFYDKGKYSDGWRYLEAAPEDLKEEVCWGDVGNYGTKEGIGEGKENTDIIVNKASKIYVKQKNAAISCKEYSYNGYNDWFLPSKDELKELKSYLNIKEKIYWSSSEGSGCDDSEYVAFSSCEYYFRRAKECAVRPIRRY